MDPWKNVRLIAHRCGGDLAPENSLAGLELARAHGYRAVEFDVMLSADGTPVLIHDETIDRTTNGRGAVSALSDRQLVSFTLGCGRFAKHARFAGERIPLLADAAARCRALGLLANVEIKPAAGFEEATAERVAAMSAVLWRDAPRPLLSSFSEAALAVAQAVAPELPRALLVETVPADWAARVERLGCVALHCSARQIGWRWLDTARARGLAVRCYTVNRAAQATRLFGRGVDGLFTDALDRLRDIPAAS